MTTNAMANAEWSIAIAELRELSTGAQSTATDMAVFSWKGAGRHEAYIEPTSPKTDLAKAVARLNTAFAAWGKVRTFGR